MTEYLLIMLSTVFVNNIVMVKILGSARSWEFPKNWKPQ